MDDKDFIKIIEFIQGAYNRILSNSEIKIIKDELEDITYKEFIESIKTTLLAKVDYFTVQELHKVVDDYREAREWLQRAGLKSFDELYEN